MVELWQPVERDDLAVLAFPLCVAVHGCLWYMGLWSPHWFHLQWPQQWILLNIAVKELLPIVMSAAAWGRFWRGKSVVRIYSDNMVVVYAINKRSVRCPMLMHLLRALFFIEAHFSLLRAEHIAGVANFAADHLSRDKIHDFFISCSQADPSPSRMVYSRCCSTSISAGHPRVGASSSALFFSVAEFLLHQKLQIGSVPLQQVLPPIFPCTLSP